MAGQSNASQLWILSSCAVPRCSARQFGNGKQRPNGVCALSRDSEAEGCGALLENHAVSFRVEERRLIRSLALGGWDGGRCFPAASRFELETVRPISKRT